MSTTGPTSFDSNSLKFNLNIEKYLFEFYPFVHCKPSEGIL